ncbi:MAG: site-specific integrase [Roseiarcus sp.]|jgi:hypothetical protein
MNEVVVIANYAPALVAAAGDKASTRFLEFFAANIRNPHTRRAYSRAVAEFLAWCELAGIPSIAHVAPLHVATWIEAQAGLAAPSVKQRLAALRRLFDWLVATFGPPLPVQRSGTGRGVPGAATYLALPAPPAPCLFRRRPA